jgi:hypothetical protein
MGVLMGVLPPGAEADGTGLRTENNSNASASVQWRTPVLTLQSQAFCPFPQSADRAKTAAGASSSAGWRQAPMSRAGTGCVVVSCGYPFALYINEPQ